ncbi:hypothetical protein [Haliangium sp. UPWRP_2]|uniref:hypothetical protein n=1 Tax=Haliangium sp. UPWRP_2 TaxID=1931276 RepID=UPI0011B27C1A|nr:hypothetical protein [Haliangium sp. UPWRP_2]HNN90780.1 hypothetical protein [Pseudomonadota bacterium]
MRLVYALLLLLLAAMLMHCDAGPLWPFKHGKIPPCENDTEHIDATSETLDMNADMRTDMVLSDQ